MSEADAKETYEVERRVMRGMDNFTDLSLLPEDYYRETVNLTVNGGIHETRPGSTRYGQASFAGLDGEQHGMTFITTLQGEWCLAHIGNALYAAIAGNGDAPTRILDLAGAALVVSDSNHPARRPFVQIQLEFDTGGFRIYKILFRSKGGCKVIEYREADATWVGRAPAVYSNLDTLFSLSVVAVPGTGSPLGTYRVRLVPARIVNGVRIMEGPSFASVYAGDLTPYQQITLSAIGSIVQVTISAKGTVHASLTHWIIECTRELNFVGGTEFSSNGNDPSIFYEGGFPPIDNATLVTPTGFGINTGSLTTPKPDTRNFLAIPAHDLSVFQGGILFMGGLGQSQSRIFAAGADGLSIHSEIYNPGKFIPVDEADGKVMTALEIVGPHLGVWKENKTGVVLNLDPLGAVVWRDRKVGAPAQGCVHMLTENQAAVLCHDGALRFFDGSAYDHSVQLGDSGVEVSNPIRNYTSYILANGLALTATFIWHQEKLHLLYDILGNRRALVLHPRESYEWTPWRDLVHQVNALAENELRWIFMDPDSGLLYEQSPLKAVYLDRDKDLIQWRRHDGALWPKNRRSSMVVEDVFLEGIFGMLTEAHFELDEKRVIGAAVGLSPNPGTKATTKQRWLKAWAEANAELRCHSMQLVLEGIGYSLHRAMQYRVIEEASLGVPSVPDTEGDPFMYLPTWQAPVVIYARFEQDAETQYDFSGHRRNLIWQPGVAGDGLRSHVDAMIPYGGEYTQGPAVDAGWVVPSWDGMDYIGDDDGVCSRPQTFEFVFCLADSENVYFQNGFNEKGGFQIFSPGDGRFRFVLNTVGGTPKNHIWRSTDPVMGVSTPDDPYVMQICLYNGGDSLRVWCGKASEKLSEVEIYRTEVFSFFHTSLLIGGFSNIYLSHFRRLLSLRTEQEARAFHNYIKGTL